MYTLKKYIPWLWLRPTWNTNMVISVVLLWFVKISTRIIATRIIVSTVFSLITSWYGSICRITGLWWVSQMANNAEICDTRFNTRLNKRWGCWWFDTPWRLCDVALTHLACIGIKSNCMVVAMLIRFNSKWNHWPPKPFFFKLKCFR